MEHAGKRLIIGLDNNADVAAGVGEDRSYFPGEAIAGPFLDEVSDMEAFFISSKVGGLLGFALVFRLPLFHCVCAAFIEPKMYCVVVVFLGGGCFGIFFLLGHSPFQFSQKPMTPYPSMVTIETFFQPIRSSSPP